MLSCLQVFTILSHKIDTSTMFSLEASSHVAKVYLLYSSYLTLYCEKIPKPIRLKALVYGFVNNTILYQAVK